MSLKSRLAFAFRGDGFDDVVVLEGAWRGSRRIWWVRRALTIYDGALERQSSMTVLDGARAF